MFELITPLSPDECQRRLVGAGGEWQFYNREVRPYDTRILVRVHGDKFLLWRYDGLVNHFGFQFYGRLVPIPGATRIQGLVRISFGSIGFLALALAFLIGVATLSHFPQITQRFELRVLMLFAALAILILAVQMPLARRHTDPFLAFLRSTLDAIPQ